MTVTRSIKRGLETVGLYSNRYITENLTRRIRGAAYNLESRQLLPELDLPFIPQTSFALSASAIRIILNDVVLHQRRCVVELGAGMSTLFLAKVLQGIPGSSLISVDHDSNWLAFIGSQLKRVGADSVVHLVHAPLEAVELTDEVKWYSRPVILDALKDRVIDSVIVDGPKARHANDAETRSHALGMVLPHLNPAGSAVFMDDIKRQGEKRIYERWARDFDFEKVSDAEFCGLGILVPRGHPMKFTIV